MTLSPGRNSGPTRSRPLKKVSNACIPCRKRKVKCSGRNPCESCTIRHVQCVYEQSEKKVVVTESYLHELQQSQARTNNTGLPLVGETTTEGSPFESDLLLSPSGDNPQIVQPVHITTGEHEITNPLVSETSFYLKEASGRYRLCGPSSNWSFSQRIFLLLKRELPDFPSPELPFHVDGSACALNWAPTSLEACSMLESLPSFNDAIYLLSTVRFHTYQVLFLVDEDDFILHLHEFYKKGIEKVKSARLWFIQYLLVVALGKAFLAVSKAPGISSGSTFFERAMSIMPDFVGLHREPNLAMQVSCLTSLYLMSVDMKDSAYAYAGQAIRLCMIEGLHREPPDHLFGKKFANQCRDIWWTVYILDRQLSAMVGAPSSIQDAEITCALPISYDSSEAALFRTMHIKILRIVGQVLSSVYSSDARLTKSFLQTMQSVLRDMAHILRDIEGIYATAAHPTIRMVSTMTSHLNLAYHQCIILATRPLMLYFLIKRLEKPPQLQDRELTIRTQLRPLLETSLQSAKVSARTLLLLYGNSLLESFLPFDLESISSSAFVLSIASFIDSSLVPDIANYTAIMTRMLDDLVSRGNTTACLRKRELDLLQTMIQRVVEKSHGDQVERLGSVNPLAEREGSVTAGQYQSEQLMPDHEDISMSHSLVLDVAQQLDILNGSTGDIDLDFDNSIIWT